MTIPNLILVEKNKLSQTGAWPWLLDLTPAGSATTYHYTSNTVAVVYNSTTYEPLPFRIQTIDKSADGSLTVLQIIVSDIGLALQSILRANEGLRGATVMLTQVNTELLAQDFSGDALTYQISHCQNQYTDVVFYCGVPGSLKHRVPEDLFLAKKCRHDFRVPAGPFQNLVAPSEAFTTWGNYYSGPTVTDNTADLVAPNGTPTASKWVTPGGGPQGKIAYRTGYWGQTFTVSVWLRGAVGGEQVTIGVTDGSEATKTLTTAWVRYTYTATMPTLAGTVRQMQIRCSTAATFYVWGAQAQEGTTPGLYFQTTSAPRDPRAGDYGSRCGYAGATVSAVTLSGTSPVSVAATAHGFITGDEVRVYGMDEIPGLDGDYTITRTDANNFTLDGTDSSDYTGTYTAGGKAGYASCARILTTCRNLSRSSNYGGIAAMRADTIRLGL